MAISGSGRLKPAATCVIIAAVLCLVVACSSKAPAASTPQQAAALFYQPLHQDANLNAAQWQQLLQLIKDIPMDGKQGYDVLGFIYEYLIGMFAANAGKEARFSDGSAVMAADVVHSFNTLMSKQASPQFKTIFGDIKAVRALDERLVKFEFASSNRELPLVAGSVPVFSRKWGAGKPFDGRGLDWRAQGGSAAPPRTRHCNGVSELCRLSASDRVREHCLPAFGAR